MNHKELVEIAYRWVYRIGWGVAFKELVSMGSEIPDVIAFRSGETCLIECKASRGDFLADKKKRHRQVPEMGLGKFRFYMCPSGLIKPEELLEGWGLIYVGDKGKAEYALNPYNPMGGNIWRGGFVDRNTEKEVQIMYSALRRMPRKMLESVYLKSETNGS